MFIQIWKNVVGDFVPYKIVGDTVKVTMSRGNRVSFTDLTVKLKQMQDELDKLDTRSKHSITFMGCLNEEGLMEFCFNVHKKEIEVETAPELPVEQESKKKGKKKETEIPVSADKEELA